MAVIDRACRQATIGCVECKYLLAGRLIGKLEPSYQRRKDLEGKKGQILEVLQEGSARARVLAGATMEEVRAAMNVAYRA
ncbi:MAG: hypothetical protein HYX74_11945 [Acidobacteria bacterium]|nr:hypothetical protein [Acidobacteriota bacterium]